MQSLVILTISGDEFFFENSGFTAEQQADLEVLAQRAFIDHPKLKELTEQELCSWFISAAKEQFGIILKSIKISFVVRINL